MTPIGREDDSGITAQGARNSTQVMMSFSGIFFFTPGFRFISQSSVGQSV